MSVISCGLWVSGCVCVKYKKPDKKTEIDESRSESSVDSLAVKQSNLKGIAAAASHIKAFVFLSAAFKEPPFRGEQEQKVVHCRNTERPLPPPLENQCWQTEPWC